jgi:hypothetical protein
MNEIVEVWCVNDAFNAVGVVDGQSYCATCYAYAFAEQGKAARLTDEELVVSEEREWSALHAYPTEGGRRAWEALNAEIGKRGLAR